MKERMDRRAAEYSRLCLAAAHRRIRNVTAGLQEWAKFSSRSQSLAEVALRRARKHGDMCLNRRVFDAWKEQWFLNIGYHFWKRHLRRRAWNAMRYEWWETLKQHHEPNARTAQIRQEVFVAEADEAREYAERMTMQQEEDRQRWVESEIKRIAEEESQREAYKYVGTPFVVLIYIVVVVDDVYLTCL